MNKGTGKKNKSNSGKKYGQGLLRDAGSVARSNLRKGLGTLLTVEKSAKTGSGTLLSGRDRVARRCRDLREVLGARIGRLKRQELPSPKKIPYSAQKFEQIMEKEVKQREDRMIWETYSKHGGISDTLADIRNAVERPSSNAFDFDDEEGTYIIYITLNNTYISRMSVLCSGMCSESGQIERMEGSELQKERERLQEFYNELCFEKEILSKKPLSKEWKEALDAKLEKTLLKLNEDLDSYERKRKDYGENVKAYQEQWEFFIEECEQQYSYIPRYDELFEKLTKLGKINREDHPFHMLTISPEGETELRQYMETAREFSKWTLHITEEYPL